MLSRGSDVVAGRDGDRSRQCASAAGRHRLPNPGWRVLPARGPDQLQAVGVRVAGRPAASWPSGTPSSRRPASVANTAAERALTGAASVPSAPAGFAPAASPRRVALAGESETGRVPATQSRRGWILAVSLIPGRIRAGSGCPRRQLVATATGSGRPAEGRDRRRAAPSGRPCPRRVHQRVLGAADIGRRDVRQRGERAPFGVARSPLRT